MSTSRSPRTDWQKRAFNDRVGAAFRAAREGAGLSRAELARRMGVNDNTIAHMEDGHTTLSLWIAAKAADVIDCTIDAMVPLDALDAGGET
jgi:DNA-binding XRE family transcriptional regulator